MDDKENKYQTNFSEMNPGATYDRRGRERKAETMVAVLSDFIEGKLNRFTALDVGCSTGIITNHLSKFFQHVIGMDIDAPALQFAKNNFEKENLDFIEGSSLQMDFAESTFDVVLCAHIYEHVPDADKLMSEIYRVLKKRGVCFFAAGNRLRVMEPHYNVPLLSILPEEMAHIYLRVLGKGRHYSEKHLCFWELKKLVRHFERFDYTKKIIEHPEKFKAEYMIQPNSWKARLAELWVEYLYFLCPTYIWVLRKP